MVSLDGVENCEEPITFVQKGSSIWCVYKDFHLKSLKSWTSLEQVKLVKTLEEHPKLWSGNKF